MAEELELNCRLQKSDFLKIGDINKGTVSISIIETRTGETLGVCIDKEQIKKLIIHLNNLL